MAAGDLLLKYGTQLLFADHGTDFGAAPATAANNIIVGVPVDVDMDLTGLAAAGGARESDKTATLGATRGTIFRVDACLEFETAPADGGTVDFYWGGSPNTTAASGNPASLTGTDAAVTETDGKLGQLQYIGTMTLENDVINIGRVGTFVPEHLYGILVIENNGSTALRSTATAMDETHVTVTPLIYNTEQ